MVNSKVKSPLKGFEKLPHISPGLAGKVLKYKYTWGCPLATTNLYFKQRIITRSNDVFYYKMSILNIIAKHLPNFVR